MTVHPPEPAPEASQAPAPAAPTRVRWRVVMQSSPTARGDPARYVLAWHLYECRDHRGAEAHCARGRVLVAAGHDPDGHCLVDGACRRCSEVPA